jgi:hypothetical protein
MLGSLNNTVPLATSTLAASDRFTTLVPRKVSGAKPAGIDSHPRGLNDGRSEIKSIRAPEASRLPTKDTSMSHTVSPDPSQPSRLEHGNSVAYSEGSLADNLPSTFSSPGHRTHPGRRLTRRSVLTAFPEESEVTLKRAD